MQKLNQFVGLQWCPSRMNIVGATYILMDVVVSRLNSHFNKPIPTHLATSTICILTGIFLYYVEPYGDDYQGITYIPPKDLLFFFMPLYALCVFYRMDLFLYTRTITPICLMGASVLVFTFLSALITIKFITHPEFSYFEAFLSTFLILPIQPEHTVDLLREMAKYRSVATILELEQIGTYTIINFFFEYFREYQISAAVHWIYRFCFIIWYFLGGIIYGLVAGKLTSYLIRILYSNATGAGVLILGVTTLVYFSCTCILNLSGDLTIMILASHLVFAKNKLNQVAEKIISDLLLLLMYFVEVSVLSLLVTESISYILSHSGESSVCSSLVLYVTITAARIIIFGIFGFFSKSIHVNYDLKTALILGLSGIKGSLNFLMVFILITHPITFALGRIMMPEVLLIYVYTLLANALPMKHLLANIGFAELSSARWQNMNTCLKHIMFAKKVIIQSLKSYKENVENYYLGFSSFLGDANWEVIRQETEINHPYTQTFISENTLEGGADDAEFFHASAAICPDCFKRVPYDLSEKDIYDLCEEARSKILKSKKISINRQYETGAIKINCQQLLLYNIDLMLDEENAPSKLDIKAYLYPHPFNSYLRKIFLKFKGTVKLTPPKNHIKKGFFYLINHIIYDLAVLCVVIVVLTITFSTCFSPVPLIDAITLLAMLCLFTIDAFLRLMALSLPHNWRKWAWLTWSVCLLCIECYLLTALVNSKTYPDTRLVIYIRTVIGTRVTYLLVAWKSIVLGVIRMLDRRNTGRIAFGFDVAAALQSCCIETIEDLNQILDVKLIRDIYTKDLQDEKKFITGEMKRIQKERPWIAITMKTKQVIRSTLHVMNEGLKELKNAGYVDAVEYNFIHRLINEKTKILRSLRNIEQSTAKSIFTEIAWLCGETEIIDYLFEKVEVVRFNIGDVVVADGQKTSGVYLVIAGALKLQYKAKPSKLVDYEEKGNIPIVDYLNSTDFYNDMEDDLMPGSTFGEKSILTRRKYNSTITAETDVVALLLTTDVMQGAFRIFKNPVTGLEAKMWKYCNINLAISIMSHSTMYKSINHKRIKFKLDRAFVPKLRCYKTFIVTEAIDDLILIDGMAKDCITEDVFIAPTLIPKTSHKLYISKSAILGVDKMDTKLMIVPLPNKSEIDVMWEEEEQAEIASYNSKCVLHTAAEMEMIHHRSKKISNARPLSQHRQFGGSSMVVDVQHLKDLDIGSECASDHSILTTTEI